MNFRGASRRPRARKPPHLGPRLPALRSVAQGGRRGAESAAAACCNFQTSRRIQRFNFAGRSNKIVLQVALAKRDNGLRANPCPRTQFASASFNGVANVSCVFLKSGGLLLCRRFCKAV